MGFTKNKKRNKKKFKDLLGAAGKLFRRLY